MLRRPSWGLGLGLRKSVLPRRPASLDLPSSHGDNNSNSNHTRSSNNNNNNNNKPTANGAKMTSSKSLLSGSEHSTHNEKWSSEKKTIRVVEEVLTSKRERDELTESQKWEHLDDLVEMAYKIRVSYKFDWEKLLEEGEEESEQDDEHEHEQHQQQSVRRKLERPERPSIHLHNWRNEAPLSGPGVLIV